MKRFSFSPLVWLALAILFIGQSCASADRLIESGDYDTAIQYAQQRLVGKKNKNPELVRALEDAFHRANERDLATAERLKADGRPENWSRVHDTYRRIQRRQDALLPLLPLIDKEGFQAHFTFVQIDDLARESRNQAALYHYDRARDLLDQSRRLQDKMAARAAYRELEEVQTYFRDFRDVAELRRVAHELGTVHIVVGVENNAPVVAPTEFERRLRQLNVADLNSFWQQYHLQMQPAITYDYRMVLRITDIAVSPEQVREREYTDLAEIEDGFEYVLDANGNVLKDSLGNDIKQPRRVLVKAWVLEVQQRKQADVQGTLEVYDLHRNQQIRSQNLGASAIFEHFAATFRGDERALSRDSRRCIGNRPMPFPSNEALILDAADQLKPALLSRLSDYRELI